MGFKCNEKKSKTKNEKLFFFNFLFVVEMMNEIEIEMFKVIQKQHFFFEKYIILLIGNKICLKRS